MIGDYHARDKDVLGLGHIGHIGSQSTAMATLNTIFARYSYGSLEIKWLQDTVLARDINVHLRMIVPLVIQLMDILLAAA